MKLDKATDNNWIALDDVREQWWQILECGKYADVKRYIRTFESNHKWIEEHYPSLSKQK